jgi:hypothetical protein
MVAQREAEPLLPKVVEQRKPGLGSEEKLFRFRRVVGIIPPRAPKVVDVRFGIRVSKDKIEIEEFGRRKTHSS